MKIRFQTTIADIVAFNRFHYANSPAWRRQVWKQVLLVPAMLGVLLLLVLVIDKDLKRFSWFYWILSVLFLIMSLGWGAFIRVFMNWSLERNTRKFLAEGSNRTLLGWRELELVNGRLVADTELINSHIDLRAIEKIISNDDYTFVYISAVQAYIIPMRLYPEEEYREFVAELRQAWENRDAPRQDDVRDVPVRRPDDRFVQRPY